MEQIGATIREVNGRLVLDDPDALAMVRALEKHNCRGTLSVNADRVAAFDARAKERGFSYRDAVIVVLMVDDPNAAMMADVLMPGHDWDAIRATGDVPVARGIADRGFVESALCLFDNEALEKLRSRNSMSVVVVNGGVAEIFDPSEAVARVSYVSFPSDDGLDLYERIPAIGDRLIASGSIEAIENLSRFLDPRV